MKKNIAKPAEGKILYRFRPTRRFTWELEIEEGVHKLMGVYLPKFVYTVREPDKELQKVVRGWKKEGKIKLAEEI